MRSFTCSCCGKTHEGVTDIAFDAPYYYLTVPEAERAARCKLSDDLCSIDDEDFFIRGILMVPIKNHDEDFAWGAWCSVSRENFQRYVEVFDDPAQAEVGPFFGWFSNLVPGYPDTLSVKLMAHLQDETTRPHFVLDASDHPFAIDQRDGISLSRLEQIYEQSLHPPAPDQAADD